MLSVIIPRTDIPKVVQLTEENMMRELKSIIGAELMLEDSWLAGLSKVRNDYVCLVEPDCLVSSGYFESMLGLFKKNPYFRKLAMMSASTGIVHWGDRIFGYCPDKVESEPTKEDKITTIRSTMRPQRQPHSKSPYPVQMGFVPGAIVRTAALRDVVKNLKFDGNLQKFSSDMSFKLWDTGRMVYINPNATYVTTEKYVGEDSLFEPRLSNKYASVFETGDL